MVLYVGGYSPGTPPAVSVVDDSGEDLAVVHTVACPDHPSYLAKTGRTLVAVHEITAGAVTSFAIDDGIRLLTTVPSGGSEPCHVSIDPSGRFVFVAHWGDGSVSVLPLDADGMIGPPVDVVSHAIPRAHMVITDPSAQWVLVVHFGNTSLITFAFDSDAARPRLRLHHVTQMQASTGPRHLAFAPDGATLYVSNELDSSVTACAFDAETGTITPLGTVATQPSPALDANYLSAIRVGPDGTIYVANRGADSVTVMAAQPELHLSATVPCGGHWPRDIVLADDGRRLYVANERSNRISQLDVQPADGRLALSDRGLDYPSPSSIVPG